MTIPPGESSYFSAPEPQLDPNLFEGTRLRYDVRTQLWGMLVAGLGRYLDLRGVDDWAHAWLAGSGISYQWSAGRGNGDLDVLFGVDMPEFIRRNPHYQGVPEEHVANYADRTLKDKMWPVTSHTHFGDGVYEATFYWAPGVHGDIRRIHPYAAYDLKGDAWVVPPPALPHDPRTLYPGEWFDAAGRDTDAAEQIARRHASLTGKLASIDPGSAAAVNARSELGFVVHSARDLFTDIHEGRQAAFGPQGRGYGDYANFRWQNAKETGVAGALKHIISSHHDIPMPEQTSADDIIINRAGRRYGQ